MSTATGLAAASIMAALGRSGSALQPVSQPTHDTRSDGHHFDVEVAGQRFTVLVFVE